LSRVVTAEIAISYFDRQNGTSGHLGHRSDYTALATNILAATICVVRISYGPECMPGRSKMLECGRGNAGVVFTLVMLCGSAACAKNQKTKPTRVGIDFGFCFVFSLSAGEGREERFPRPHAWWRSGFRLNGDQRGWAS